ncbi:Calpain-1 catalytic subunit, partial [Blomia tropicalis]
ENRDFEFYRQLLKYEQQDYDQIKEECLRKGVLFEDDLFSANTSSYYLHSSKRHSMKVEEIEWLRPNQIIGCNNDEMGKKLHFVHNSIDKNGKQHKKPLIIDKRHEKRNNFQKQIMVRRGPYGCSNYTSALVILFCNETNFSRVVPDDQSFESNDYAGIFHFRIWQYGNWYDIVVDDRLPTIRGKLISVHCHNNSEFWPPLLEKAFAKLNGCYQSLHSCAVGEFLEDMTGGLCESINSDMPGSLNESLFNILCQSLKLNSHVVVRIGEKNLVGNSMKSNQRKQCRPIGRRQLQNGLIKNQSYVVIETKLLDLGGEKILHLIKLCNPWKRINQMPSGLKSTSCLKNGKKDDTERTLNTNTDGKWNGSWSELSDEWINLSDDVKTQFDLMLEHDSHFWMPIENFVDTFTDVDICHSASGQGWTPNNSNRVWYSNNINGSWITSVSAGGCFNEETFHENPIYLIPVHSEKSVPKSASSSSTLLMSTLDKHENSNRCSKSGETVLIGLMQKYRNSKWHTGMYDLKIGFHLFRLELDNYEYIDEILYDLDLNLPHETNKNSYQRAMVRFRMKPEFFQRNKGEQALKYFTNWREVTTRYRLQEGNYLIVPSTYGPNCDGNFLLRVYCEIPCKFFDQDVLRAKLSQNSERQIRLRRTRSHDHIFSRPLDKISTFNESVDVEHLEVLLKSVITSKRNHFSLDQCQTLLVMYDLDCKGTLSFAQLQQLCTDIDECFRLFLRHDKTISRSISCSELRVVLTEIGINANQAVIDMLVNRYGSKMKIVVNGVHIRELLFPNFAICLLKLRKTLIFWDIKLRNSCVAKFDSAHQSIHDKEIQTKLECDSLHFTLVEFIKQIIYS